MTDLEKRLRAALKQAPDARYPIRNKFSWDEILAAARLGAELEREACAQIAGREADRWPCMADARNSSIMIENTIRARGGK